MLFSCGSTTTTTDSRLRTRDVLPKCRIFTASENQPAPVAADRAGSRFLWAGARRIQRVYWPGYTFCHLSFCHFQKKPKPLVRKDVPWVAGDSLFPPSCNNNPAATLLPLSEAPRSTKMGTWMRWSEKRRGTIISYRPLAINVVNINSGYLRWPIETCPGTGRSERVTCRACSLRLGRNPTHGHGTAQPVPYPCQLATDVSGSMVFQ